MIDIEPMVVTALHDALAAQYPACNLVSVYERSPAHFPTVNIHELDNVPWAYTQDTDSQENHAEITFEVNIYSNKIGTARSECRAIAGVVDECMLRLGFDRIIMTTLQNLDNQREYRSKTDAAVIHRICARYRAVVGKNKTIYRR